MFFLNDTESSDSYSYSYRYGYSYRESISPGFQLQIGFMMAQNGRTEE